jgi:hypothetical protein
VSTATEPTTETPPTTAPAACATCGAPLEPGQDWCVECGAAVHAGSGDARRRFPGLAVLAVAVVLAGAGAAFAWAALSSGSDDARRISAPVPSTVATSTAPAPTASTPTNPSTTPGITPTTPSAAAPGDVQPGTQTTTSPSPSAGSTRGASPSPATSATVGAWPPGKRAYTVILNSATSRGSAQRIAKRLASQGVTGVGILDSGKYPSLQAGYTVVFSGQYADVGAAQQAAQRLSAQAPGAYAKLVSPR